MGKATKDEMIAEAKERLNILKISPACKRAFAKGQPWMSEQIGFLYEINEPDVLAKIKEIEDNGKRVVYHVIHNMLEFGECYSLMLVTNDPEDWESDKEDLADGYAFAYIWNKSDDMMSEYGSIVVKPNIGGLKRIG